MQLVAGAEGHWQDMTAAEASERKRAITSGQSGACPVRLGYTECTRSALTDSQREEGDLMHPTGSDPGEVRIARDAHAAQQDARQAELRLLIEHCEGLVQELRALHERALSLLRSEQMSDTQRRAQLAASVRVETEVIEEVQHVQRLILDLVSVLHRTPQEDEEPHERLAPAPTPGDQ